MSLTLKHPEEKEPVHEGWTVWGQWLEAPLELLSEVPAPLLTLQSLHWGTSSEPAQRGGEQHRGRLQRLHIPPPSPAQRCCFLTPDSHCSDRQLMEPHKNAGLWLIVTFIPVALLGRSSALSLSFLPHVTALLLFKHGSVFNLISLFLFSFDKGKEIFSNRLKTRPLTQDQVQWAIRGNRILMANAKLWESQENKSHWRKNNLCFKSIKRKWDVEKSSGLKSHCKRGCDRAWAKSQGELGGKSQWAFCAGAEVWKCLYMYIIQCTMW